MKKKYDIITVGSGLVDAFVYTDVKEKGKEIRFPVGTKILINDLHFAVGGGGTNTATALAYLGMKTGFLGKVGHGYNAQIILRELKKHNVDFIGIESHDHTGYSLILETDKKNRTILTYKGASNNLRFPEIKSRLNTGWVHFTSLGGESFKTQKKIMSYCKKNGIKTSFNPSSYQTALGLRRIGSMIRNSYVVSMNKEEARMLVKGDLCRKLHELGPEIVVLTCNGDFGEVYDGKFRYKFYPNKVRIAEKTGAGDVFSSSFVAGLIKGKDIETSIKIAMANAESHVSTKGAKTGLLSFSEVRGKIKKGKYRVEREGI